MLRLARTISFSAPLWAIAPLFAQSTYVVPGTHPTIQAAIDATINGDTVLVTPGTYVENLDVQGKDITIRGFGAAFTIVDGGGVGPTIKYSPGSTRLSVLEDLTVTNGAGVGAATDALGGGIRIVSSSPTIRRCTIRNNTSGSYGAGIGGTDFNGNGSDCSPRIEGCVIEDNVATGVSFASGGGIGLTGFSAGAATGQAEIVRCRIQRNTANGRGGGIYVGYNQNATIEANEITENTTLGSTGSLDGGAAIFAALNAVPTIQNNRIWENVSANNGGGIKFFNVSGMQIVNNTIVDNIGGGIAGYASAATFGVNVYADVVNTIVWNPGSPEFTFTGTAQGSQPPYANVSYCDVNGGYAGTGNINANPQLLNASSGNHRLLGSSPCRNAGTNAVALPATDFEGQPRVTEATVDIGADEYDPTAVLHWSDTAFVLASAPTNVRYAVSAGSARGGNAFFVLFGLSGTSPGLDLGPLHLPLNIDALTPSVSFVAGTLNPAGDGSSAFPFAGIAIPPALIGQTLSSAAAIIDASPVIVAFSNDENVTFRR
jgi:parallel beta-helix repeat protein